MSKSKRRHTSGNQKRTKQAASENRNKNPQRTINPVWIVSIVAVLVLTIGGILIAQAQSQPIQSQSSDTSNDVVSSFPDEVSVDEAFQKYDSGVFLLDVREPAEWTDFHVPNTTHIPLGELESRVDELPADQEIVVVCRSGNRSQKGRDILRSAGFDEVSSMAGGLKEWQAAGYPTVSGP